MKRQGDSFYFFAEDGSISVFNWVDAILIMPIVALVIAALLALANILAN